MFGLTSDQWLQIIVLPIVFVAVGIIAKKLGRRDGDDSPHRNDWAVGTAVILMTFGKIAADLVDIPKGETTAPSQIFWWLFGLFLALFFFINHDRFASWEKDANGLVTKRKRLILGVIIPDSLSLVIFASYQAWKAGVL
jgi:hypothetical protein